MVLDTLSRRLPSIVPTAALAAVVAAAAAATACTSAAGGAPPAAGTAPTEQGAPGLAGAASAAAAYDIAYRVAMPDPTSHLYEVRIDLGRVRGGDTVRLQMPVWSPGRYARMDFARNVQDFAAETPDGRPVAWEKEHGSLWRVVAPAGGGAAGRSLRVRYRVYANTLSGTFSALDTAHANWNGPSMYMYVEGHKADPVRLSIVPPAGWAVMNGATPLAGAGNAAGVVELSFPNYDVLADTPTEVAPSLSVDTFRLDGILYRIVVHHNGGGNTPQRRARFARAVERIVGYQNRVLGPPPIETYTFLANVGYPGGDGMEHLTSTQIMTRAEWSDTADVLPLTGTASHEYFHVWNVKRVRPAALGPFDYTREQYQPSLWVAEGWTNYYGGMTMHRAGLIDRAALYGELADVIQYNSETPGRTQLSARMASFHAPFYDGAAEPMATNRAGVWISYYLKGEALALLLDLEIRSRTRGARSLDDVLRTLKQRTWDAPSTSYYLQGRGYTEADVLSAVSDAAGSDFSDWFDRYVAGVEELPFAETLARTVGVELVVRAAGPSSGGGRYALRDLPGATADQRRIREGWLAGR